MTNNSSAFTFTVHGSLPNKIECIKAIRSLTGLGLKQAKDASELIGKPQTYEIDSNLINTYPDPTRELESQFLILRNNGIEVADPVFKLLEELRKIGAAALLQGEDELANGILQLVLVEKLRRGPGIPGAR